MSSWQRFRRIGRAVAVLVAAVTAVAVVPLAVGRGVSSAVAAPTAGSGTVLIEDTYVVDFDRTGTRDGRSYLRVGAGAVAYLKFQVAEPPSDAHAILWLHSSTRAATEISVYRVAPADWSANDLTWNNQPGLKGSPIASFIGTNRDEWTPVDVSGLISAPGTYSIGLTGVHGGAKFDAQESITAPLLDLGSSTPPPSEPTATPPPTTTLTPTASSSTPPPPAATTSSSTPSGPGAAKVMVIVDENHTQAQAQASMPYLVSLQNAFGVTSHHTATTHPSLPNYLEIAGGSTFGVTDDAAPGSHPIAGVSVFGSALARGESARTYNESMSTACQQTSSGNYAVKHNPWAYFLDERTECQANDLPLTSLPGDITAGTLPNIGMITPDLCNDGHDCSLGTADAFLQTWIPRIMNGPDYRSGRLTVVVTFDEGVGTDQTIQTVVVNPALHGVVV